MMQIAYDLVDEIEFYQLLKFGLSPGENVDCIKIEKVIEGLDEYFVVDWSSARIQIDQSIVHVFPMVFLILIVVYLLDKSLVNQHYATSYILPHQLHWEIRLSYNRFDSRDTALQNAINHW